MTKRLKIEIRRSHIRSRRAEIAKLPEAEQTAEIRAEAEALDSEYQTSETELREAIAEEERDEALRSSQVHNDGESAEVRELRGRVSVRDYVGAALEQRAAEGAALEFNQALGMPGNRFPLELLAPRVERRATTDVDAGAMQQSWLDRLFSETAAARVGITFRSVAPGVASYPVTTAGASAAQRGRREAAADAAWTVGVTEIKPTRNTVRLVFSDEDSYRIPGLEDALRRDLGMALAEGIDRSVFIGDVGANEDRADIVGLQTLAGVEESTVTQANKAKGEGTLAAFATMVDGKHASGIEDLGVVAAVGAARLWLSENITGASGAPQTLAKYLRDAGLSWMVRGDIEEATAADDIAAFVGRRRGIEGAAVAAMWNSAMLIRDIYSGAAKGECALTLATFWGFKVPRPSNFGRVTYVA